MFFRLVDAEGGLMRNLFVAKAFAVTLCDCGPSFLMRGFINQLSYHHTFGSAKDETIAAGKGEPLTPSVAFNVEGGEA